MLSLTKINIAMLAAMILCTTSNIAFASDPEWSPPLDYSRVDQEIRADLPTLGDIPKSRRQDRIIFDNANIARELFSKGDFAEALKYYHYLHKTTNLTGYGHDSNVKEAECLEKLNRVSEAIPIYRDEVAHHCSQDACEHLVHLLIDLKQYEEALLVCDRLSCASYSERGTLLKSEVLEASGDLAAALNAAQQAYYHCWHTGDDARDAGLRLKALKSEPPKIMKINNTQTEAILNYLHKFADMKVPPSQEAVRKTFGLEMSIIGRAWEPETTFRDYVSRKDRSQSLIEIRYGNETLARDGYILSLDINPDFASITPEMIKKQFGDVPYFPFKQSGDVVQSGEMSYENRSPAMTMFFESGGLNPLHAVHFTWLISQQSSGKSEARHSSRASKKVNSHNEMNSQASLPQSDGGSSSASAYEDVPTKTAEKELKQLQFAEAKSTLEMSWRSYPDAAPQQRLDVMRHRRRLLASAYRGLKQNDVADFVEQAPVNIIHRVIIQNLPGDPLKLLTAEQYGNMPWTVEGWSRSATDGQLIFRWCGFLICVADSKSPRWSEYFHLFPDPKGQMKIPVPQGALRDMIDDDEFRVGR